MMSAKAFGVDFLKPEFGFDASHCLLPLLNPRFRFEKRDVSLGEVQGGTSTT